MKFITEEEYMQLLNHICGKLSLAEASSLLDKKYIIDDELANANMEEEQTALSAFI